MSTEIYSSFANDSWVTMNITHVGSNLTAGTGNAPAGMLSVVVLSALFIIIGTVGIFGNLLVAFVIICFKKMHSSVTNIMIANLAVADLFILTLGVPEIAQFVLNQGWVLGHAACRANRYVTVTSLYVSVMSLVLISVDRYIATIHPVRAHVLWRRNRVGVAIFFIWVLGLLCGLPTVFFNDVTAHENGSVQLCLLKIPGERNTNYLIFKYTEFSLFFFVPVVVQVTSYSIIVKQLFIVMRGQNQRENNARITYLGRAREIDTRKTRKSIIKMLIAVVVIYVISYAPAQVPTFYDTFSSKPFKTNWSFLALVMILSYINSAANPIVYCIFSKQFRRYFFVLIRNCCSRRACCSSRCTGIRHGTYSSTTPHLNGGIRLQTMALQL